jgi:hypothetical protein
MSDAFNVTAAYNAPSYTQGQTITVTISGNDVLTTTTTGTVGPVSIPIVAADGATGTVSIPAENVTLTVTTPESVTIDTTRAIVDTSPTPRTWTVAANKLSISATA